MALITYTACPCCGSSNIKEVLKAEDFTVSHEKFAIWECGDCTLRFTQDIPDGPSVGAYYKSENYISHSDTKEGLVNSLYHKVRQRTLKAKHTLVQKVTGLKTGKLLDLGAGTGAFLSFMNTNQWDVVGLEPDDVARAKAKELYNLDLRSADQLFQLPSGNFDVITMWHVLEHVHELHPYIEQLHKLLKKNGKLIIAVPNYTSYDASVYKEYWAAYDVPRHLYHFSPASIKKLVSQHGMKVESEHAMWFDSFYISMLSEQYKNGKGNLPMAFINGLLSNTKTSMNKEKCSSLVYVISGSR
ncbi:class I SAM-dependent methyltransferase [Chitinophagaceae bacterium 26-R-25]|nr:class I SAM-dependent methyltransferase [Chitinophagaceae bacterium 26-R-25]